MNVFETLTYTILFGLTFLCFYIPFRHGQKQTGKIVGVTLSTLLILTAIGRLDFFEIFVLLFILGFQILFLVYWTFRVFQKRKIGQIASSVLTIGFLLFILQPWISDWLFNKNDVRKIFTFHYLELRDDFKILKNESGGYRDYYETFTLKLSDNDFIRISQTIKNSKNYKGFFKDDSNLPLANYSNLDTIDFETENYFVREYCTSKKMKNGTHHFDFRLDKRNKELEYTGSID